MLKNKVVFDTDLFRVGSVWCVKTVPRTFYGTVLNVTGGQMTFGFYGADGNPYTETVTVDRVQSGNVGLFQMNVSAKPLKPEVLE